MASRRNVGIAVALAGGMALGYAVRPSAQVFAPGQVESFVIESTPTGRVRVTMTTNDGTAKALEDARLYGRLKGRFIMLHGAVGAGQAGYQEPIVLTVTGQ